MTVSNTASRWTYVGNGVTTAFSYGNLIFAARFTWTARSSCSPPTIRSATSGFPPAATSPSSAAVHRIEGVVDVEDDTPRTCRNEPQ